MDLEKQLSSYIEQYTKDKGEVEDKLQVINREAHELATHYAKQDENGSKLLTQKDQLIAQYTARKKQLDDERKKLDHKLNSQKDLIDLQIFEVGAGIAKARPDQGKVFLERESLQIKLNALNQEGMNEIANMLQNKDGNPPGGMNFSDASKPRSRAAPPSASGIPSNNDLKPPKFPQSHVSGGRSPDPATIFQRYPGRPASQAKMCKGSKSISEEQFDEISKIYTHACLKGGIVYLQACSICGRNAPRDMKPDHTEGHFIRGDAGFLAHIGISLKDTSVHRDNLEGYLKRTKVSYEDAVLMSEGKAPRKPVIIKNGVWEMPYEEFKKRRSTKAANDASPAASDETMSAPPKPAPKNYPTLGGRVSESGERIVFNRSHSLGSSFAAKAGQGEGTDSDNDRPRAKRVRLSEDRRYIVPRLQPKDNYRPPRVEDEE